MTACTGECRLRMPRPHPRLSNKEPESGWGGVEGVAKLQDVIRDPQRATSQSQSAEPPTVSEKS
jgi:hypothetical protein